MMKRFSLKNILLFGGCTALCFSAFTAFGADETSRAELRQLRQDIRRENDAIRDIDTKFSRDYDAAMYYLNRSSNIRNDYSRDVTAIRRDFYNILYDYKPSRYYWTRFEPLDVHSINRDDKVALEKFLEDQRATRDDLEKLSTEMNNLANEITERAPSYSTTTRYYYYTPATYRTRYYYRSYPSRGYYHYPYGHRYYRRGSGSSFGISFGF